MHGLVFIFRNLVTDWTDNHYKQVIENLKTTYAVAKDKMGDYAENFEKWINTFETEEIGSVALEGDWEPQYTQELNEKLAEIQKADYAEKWNDVYKEDNIGIAFKGLLGKFILYNSALENFKDSFEQWIKIHRSICKKADNIQVGNHILDIEKGLGIDLKGFAAE